MNHDHFCPECETVWTHADVDCTSASERDKLCPDCQEQFWMDTVDEDDQQLEQDQQDLARAMQDEQDDNEQRGRID